MTLIRTEIGRIRTNPEHALGCRDWPAEDAPSWGAWEPFVMVVKRKPEPLQPANWRGTPNRPKLPKRR
jgi:hypothetical protein